MPRPDPAWLDRQYDNRARIPEHVEIFERWRQASALAREGLSCRLDLRYGDGPDETLDLFPSPRAGAPVFVFIHGGWWRSLDKRDLSFVAPSLVHAGAMVVLPNHTLLPALSLDAIVMQLVRALAWTQRHAALYGGDPKRIVVAGHSSGAHLATMLLTCDWKAVGRDLPARVVQAALAISGVFDLESVRRAPFLADDLRLTPARARKLSPARFAAPRGRLYALVGSDESEEFLRQNALIGEAWGRRVVPVCETVPGTHHFDVLHDLADPSARLHALARELLGLGVPA